MRTLFILIVLCGMVINSGCQTVPTPIPDVPVVLTSSPIPVSSTPGDVEMPPSLPTPSSPGLQDLIEKIKDDLATRLVIAANEISLVEVTQVEWSDSSLGCPQPGMSYLQVITPGYKVIVEANGQSYEYHSNMDAYFVSCEDQVPPVIPKP